MHTVCTLLQWPAKLFHAEMLAMPKSSHHEDFGIVFIHGWFCDVFLSTSVQKLAIFADPILTFYKVGRLWLVAKRSLAPQHKTQNTQQLTWAAAALPPAASPSTSMGRTAVPPNHGAPPLPISLCKVRTVGFGSAAVSSLVWGTNTSPIKNREEGGLWP